MGQPLLNEPESSIGGDHCPPSAPLESSSEEEDNGSFDCNASQNECAVSTFGREYKSQDIGKIDVSDSANTHIGTSVNAQDTHVGPRISASNVNIFMNGSDFSTLADNVAPQAFSTTKENSEKIVPDMKTKGSYPKNRNGCRRRRKCIILSVIASILTGAVIALIVWWTTQDTAPSKSGPSVSSTTQPPTTTTGAPEPLPFTTPSPSAGIIVITRSEWGGRNPPSNSWRSLASPFQNVLVDNLHGSHCSTVNDCISLLRKVEAGLNEAFDFNFLIDDTGSVYEARGYNHAANIDKDKSSLFPATLTLQLALIGNNTDIELTKQQAATLEAFVKNSTFTHDYVMPDPYVGGQCVLGIPGETGPDLRAMCSVKKLSTISDLCKGDCSACVDGVLTC